MPGACTVLIASAESLAKIKPRIQPEGELFAFSDGDALQALEIIAQKRPDVVALDRVFAGSSRGNALINRITSDPLLEHCEIWIVSERVAKARITPQPGQVTPAPAPTGALDAGTRRAGRVTMREGIEVFIDGNPATLVDLSVGGAQVISDVVLRPNQWVRLVLPDEAGAIRINGVVAWANFEMRRPRLTPCYRAGMDFKDADSRAVQSFCVKYAATQKNAHDATA